MGRGLQIEIQNGSATPLPLGTVGDMGIKNASGQGIIIPNLTTVSLGLELPVIIENGATVDIRQTPNMDAVVEVVAYDRAEVDPSRVPDPGTAGTSGGPLVIPIPPKRTVLSRVNLSDLRRKTPGAGRPVFTLGNNGVISS